MALYPTRKREAQRVEQELQGVQLWTTDIDERVRTRLWSIVKMAAAHDPETISEIACSAFRVQDGTVVPHTPNNIYGGGGWWQAITQFFFNADHDYALATIEAMFDSSKRYLAENEYDDYTGFINDVLATERIAFELIEGEMVEIDSQELHAEIVAPTLRLLSGRAGWEEVEQSYQEALKEIGLDPSDAITDAGRALQAALTARGFPGGSLGPQIKAAKKTGMFAPHDQTLNDAVAKIIDWVSADRSEVGDAHPGGAPTRDDAWFTVHIVGAIILRLVRETDRPQKD